MFDLSEPKPIDVTLEDIAVALSNTNRFTGHTDGPYSVAQHCVYASMMVPESIALEALMHDAHEAYTGDISAPMKALIGIRVKNIEAKIQAAINQRFGLGDTCDPRIQAVDLQLRHREAIELLPENECFSFAEAECTMRAIPEFKAWKAGIAMHRFRERFHHLAELRQFSRKPVPKAAV